MSCNTFETTCILGYGFNLHSPEDKMAKFDAAKMRSCKTTRLQLGYFKSYRYRIRENGLKATGRKVNVLREESQTSSERRYCLEVVLVEFMMAMAKRFGYSFLLRICLHYKSRRLLHKQILLMKWVGSTPHCHFFFTTLANLEIIVKYRHYFLPLVPYAFC